ncbi:hypothetical protein G15_0373 [Enterococcus avium]|nr:hypothetical protein G15_0373 [Enterococcus avium]
MKKKFLAALLILPFLTSCSNDQVRENNNSDSSRDEKIERSSESRLTNDSATELENFLNVYDSDELITKKYNSFEELKEDIESDGEDEVQKETKYVLIAMKVDDKNGKWIGYFLK